VCLIDKNKNVLLGASSLRLRYIPNTFITQKKYMVFSRNCINIKRVQKNAIAFGEPKNG